MGREGNERRQRVGGLTMYIYEPIGAGSKVFWFPTGIFSNPNVDFSGAVEWLVGLVFVAASADRVSLSGGAVSWCWDGVLGVVVAGFVVGDHVLSRVVFASDLCVVVVLIGVGCLGGSLDCWFVYGTVRYLVLLQ